MTDIDIDEALADLSLPTLKNYTFSVSPHLHQKLENHLFLLKAINKKSSKSGWVYEAIVEKLNNENLNESIPKQRRINISIDKNTLERLEANVETMKKVYTSFSKKQYILEAIYEKLDRETKEVKEELKKIQQNSP